MNVQLKYFIKTFLEWYINNVFVLLFDIIKDQITLNELSINVPGRTFVHNIESTVLRVFPVSWVYNVIFSLLLFYPFFKKLSLATSD